MTKAKPSQKSAENRLRDKARRLVKEIDEKFWQLGRVLHEVYAGVPGGYHSLMSGDGAMKDRKAMFERWGYKNFGDYCEKGLGIRKRTGENLRFAYYYFTVKQKVPTSVISQLISLGRSKVYLLAGFATGDNIAMWLKKARGLSFGQLKMAIDIARTGDFVRLGGVRRSLRVDVCVLVKYLSNIEPSLRRSGKKIPTDVQDILNWYQDQAGVRADIRLVA